MKDLYLLKIVIITFTKIEIGNYICYLKIDENNNVKKLFNKSFIELNSNEIINICEKIIKSDMIGGCI